MSRDSEGSKLYVDDGLEVLVVTAELGKPTWVKKPARLAFLGDSGRFVAWSDDITRGVVIGGRQIGSVKAVGLDPGGRYYFVVRAPGSVELGLVGESPADSISVDYTPKCLFARRGQAYLLGHADLDGDGYEVLCSTINITGNRFSLEKRVRVAAVGGNPRIIDMDVKSGKIVIEDGRDPPVGGSWMVYDIGTGAGIGLGRGLGYGLFLNSQLAARLGLR